MDKILESRDTEMRKSSRVGREEEEGGGGGGRERERERYSSSHQDANL
jgi:hypothetical protein